MPNASFDELTADVRLAVTSKGRDVEQALNWQIGHSREQDLAVIECFKSNCITWHYSAPVNHLSGRSSIRVTPLLRKLGQSPYLDFFDLIEFYQWQVSHNMWDLFEKEFDEAFLNLSRYSRRSTQDTSMLTTHFQQLERKGQLDVVASLLATDSWRYGPAICVLAETIDWGRLHRLTPEPLRATSLNEFERGSEYERVGYSYRDVAYSYVINWKKVLETLIDIEHLNLNRELFTE